MPITNEIWLAIVSGAADGSGTGSPSDPYVGNTPNSFATIYDSLPAVSIIRRMPGLFRTWGTLGNGYSGLTQPVFTPMSGQRVTGAGIFATTIQFLWDTSAFSLPAANLDYAPGQRHAVVIAGAD